MLEQAYGILYTVVLIGVAIAIVAAMIRAITGKMGADRLIGINMLTTAVVIAICLLTLLFKESFLADVGLIYVILSFLAVMLLCKIYINLFKKGGKK